MTYSNKLKNPLWQRKRLEIMQRDDFKCCLCHKAENELNVHHQYYTPETEPWEYDAECYLTLCKDCHSDVHTTFTKIVALIAFKAIKSGMSLYDIDNLLNPSIDEGLF